MSKNFTNYFQQSINFRLIYLNSTLLFLTFDYYGIYKIRVPALVGISEYWEWIVSSHFNCKTKVKIEFHKLRFVYNLMVLFTLLNLWCIPFWLCVIYCDFLDRTLTNLIWIWYYLYKVRYGTNKNNKHQPQTGMKINPLLLEILTFTNRTVNW